MAFDRVLLDSGHSRASDTVKAGPTGGPVHEISGKRLPATGGRISPLTIAVRIRGRGGTRDRGARIRSRSQGRTRLEDWYCGVKTALIA